MPHILAECSCVSGPARMTVRVASNTLRGDEYWRICTDGECDGVAGASINSYCFGTALQVNLGEIGIVAKVIDEDASYANFQID